jgi:HAD superfamily hydrolase (TIGR01490 family)
MASQQQVAAIFDMDYTLLSDSSARMFFGYLYRTGQIYNYFRRRDLAKFLGASFLYKLGLLDPTWLLINAGRLSAGQNVDHLWEISRLWFSDGVIDFISSRARERLQWHQAQGHIPIICSGSSQFVVHLVAEHLGVEEWIATEWVVHNGLLTGELRQPLTYGMGKVYWMEQWAERRGIDLSQSYFYTDHVSDRPLLERVAYPIAVNPDRRLAQIARRQAWEILHWA